MYGPPESGGLGLGSDVDVVVTVVVEQGLEVGAHRHGALEHGQLARTIGPARSLDARDEFSIAVDVAVLLGLGHHDAVAGDGELGTRLLAGVECLGDGLELVLEDLHRHGVDCFGVVLCEKSLGQADKDRVEHRSVLLGVGLGSGVDVDVLLGSGGHDSFSFETG